MLVVDRRCRGAGAISHRRRDAVIPHDHVRPTADVEVLEDRLVVYEGFGPHMNSEP